MVTKALENLRIIKGLDINYTEVMKIWNVNVGKVITVSVWNVHCNTENVPLLAYSVSIVVLNFHCPYSTLGQLEFMKSLLASGIWSSAISQEDIS